MNITLKLQNVKCGGCANTIKTKISQLEDLKNINIDIDSKTLEFDYNSTETLTKAKQLLKNIGYPVVE